MSSSHLQKGEKLAKGANKLVGKVSINLLRQVNSAVCVISIIIDVPAIAIAYAMVSSECCTPKQIDLTSLFGTIQLPYCICVLLLTSRCKLTPA